MAVRQSDRLALMKIRAPNVRAPTPIGRLARAPPPENKTRVTPLHDA
jgi:hypothetical protein